MFGIDIFSEYELDYTCKYSYENEDGAWVNARNHEKKTINGGKLIEQIAGILKRPDFLDFLIKENKLYIECFDPNSGEIANYTFVLKLIDECKS